MEIRDRASERIKRIRTRYLRDLSVVSIERARYYTESWRKTEGSGLSTGVRVALAMKNVYEHMNFWIDPDDRIAGTWTEHYLGIPLDLERGLFNDVMEIELDRFSMLRCLVRSNVRFFLYMLKRHGMIDFFSYLKQIKNVGAAMPSIGLKPIHQRDVNAYTINRRDKRILQKELLPYWKGKTVVEIFKQGLEESDVYKGDVQGFFAALPTTNSKNETIISTGAALGNWQGHVIPDHEAIITKGLLKIRQEVRDILDGAEGMAAEETDVVRSIDIALEGMIIYARRLTEKLKKDHEKEPDPAQREILAGMLESTRRVPLHPAGTFREAVQSYWTAKTALELALPFNVHTPGRLDQILYPYYTADIEKGEITRDEVCELLEELFLKIMSHNMRPYSNYNGFFAARYEGSEPVTLGGVDEHGADATNELTYVMLDAAENSKTCLNFSVRFHENSPEELYLKVADMQYHGTSNVSVLNDTVCIEAMEKRGYPRSDALNYAMASCVDLCIPAKTGSISFSVVLLCRILDMTLRNGDALTLLGLVRDAGPHTGNPDDFTSYMELEDAFVEQVAFQIRNIVDATKIRDRVFAEHLPSPHISALVQGPLEKKKDITRGGGIYDLEGILYMSSIANVVDSLYVMKKLIFEEKRFTFAQLIEAIDHNFAGSEDLHAMILGVEGKWGNGYSETDEIAHRVTKRIFEKTFTHKTYKGGFVAPFVNSMTSHTYDGRVCIATPDGRKAAKPFASSCNPYNVDKNGPTGVLRSVSRIDFTNVLGAPVNIRMHPSAIGKNPEMQKKWASLIRTYFKMGGEQLQPTVVSTDVLKAAQKHPDEYLNLVVKVGGYRAYFVDLGHEIQNEVISRSEHRSL